MLELGDLPDPGIELVSPALQADSLLLSHWGSPDKSGYDIETGHWTGWFLLEAGFRLGPWKIWSMNCIMELVPFCVTLPRSVIGYWLLPLLWRLNFMGKAAPIWPWTILSRRRDLKAICNEYSPQMGDGLRLFCEWNVDRALLVLSMGSLVDWW